MNWTKTLPTLIGCYYWAWGQGATNGEAISVFNIEGKFCVWESVQQRFVTVKEFGGEWGGRVPAPGTTWTVEEIKTWLFTLTDWDAEQAAEHIADSQSGIAATTERHRKDGK